MHFPICHFRYEFSFTFPQTFFHFSANSHFSEKFLRIFRYYAHFWSYAGVLHAAQIFPERLHFEILSWFPFAISIMLVELPYLIIAGSLATFCSYWSAGLDSTNINGFYFWILYTLFLFYCVAFGQDIATVTPNIFMAMLLLPLIIVFLFLFCGVLQPPALMPYFWR